MIIDNKSSIVGVVIGIVEVEVVVSIDGGTVGILDVGN